MNIGKWVSPLIGVDLGAEIIPGRSIGGLGVGTTLFHLEALLSGASVWDRKVARSLSEAIESEPGWLCHSSGNGGRTFWFARGALALHFSPQGTLDRLAAGPGYVGALFGTVKIGAPLRDVLEYVNLEYDSADELHFPVLADGSDAGGLLIQAEPASLTERPSQLIHRIIV